MLWVLFLIMSMGMVTVLVWWESSVSLLMTISMLVFLVSGDSVLAEMFFMSEMERSLVMVSCLLCSMTILVSLGSKKLKYLMYLSGVLSSVFFISNSWVVMYSSFELSLIPLILILVFWGKSPERTGAVYYMSMYTLVSSSPLLLVLTSSGVMGVNFNHMEVESWMIWSWMIGFMVKIPVYLMHAWLTRAHVEAPLEGSVLLAGIMLKLGIWGVYRGVQVFPESQVDVFSEFVSPLCLVGSLFSLMLGMSSDDQKVSVALSSVSHMNMCTITILTMKESMVETVMMTVLAHSIISPVLFYVVTVPYVLTHSRSALVNKGQMNKSTGLRVLCFLFWGFNMAVPPGLSFVGEVSSLSCLSMWSWSVWGIVGTYMMAMSFFCMVNYGILCHMGKEKLSKTKMEDMKLLLYGGSLGLIVLVLSF
nr:NADH dehydrogenase subunit 4 [Penenirmus auritus]